MRLKKLCITILIMITILFTANTVFAASVQTEITTTKQEVQAEKEEVVTLNLKLNNFQKIEDGLYAYKGQIQYNKDVFYELDTKNFKVKNNWTSLQYNKENNEFVVIKKSGVTDPEEFLQIDLKVKNKNKLYFKEHRECVKIDPNVDTLFQLSQCADTPESLKKFLAQYKKIG